MIRTWTDSLSLSQLCSGRKHRDNVKEYYAQFVSKQAQSVIDQIISRHMNSGGGVAAGGGFPPAPGMMGMMGGPMVQPLVCPGHPSSLHSSIAVCTEGFVSHHL